MREGTSQQFNRTRFRLPLMPEFAILSTLILIAAPVVLVGGTLAAAAKKRLSQRGERASQDVNR